MQLQDRPSRPAVVSLADTAQAPLVACVDASEDIVALLAEVMQDEGWRAVTHVSRATQGPAPTIEFLTQVRPQACIYNVSLPYAASWAEFAQIRQAVPGCAWVVTTTNKRALDELVGPTERLDIWSKPFDLDQIAASVRRALDGA
jgi:DNA-binding NtrC family response regulator